MKNASVTNKKYVSFYYKYDEIMRECIKKDKKSSIIAIRSIPGYEMLRIAWMEYQTNKNMTEEEMIEIVKNKISLVTSQEKVEKQRNPILQKMIEVIRSVGDEEASPLEFIKKIS